MQTFMRIVQRFSLNQFALLASSVGALVIIVALSWGVLSAPTTGRMQSQGAACDAACLALLKQQMHDLAEQVRELERQPTARNAACDATCLGLLMQQMYELAEQMRALDGQTGSPNTVVCDAACLERLKQ